MKKYLPGRCFHVKQEHCDCGMLHLFAPETKQMLKSTKVVVNRKYLEVWFA